MSNPIIHAESSAKNFGGDMNDYINIHEKMDCSKAWMPDNRHRVLTHTMFWIKEVMIPIYGSYITNSDGKKISVKDICERHILEDYKMKFIPTPQDFIQEMNVKDWMKNGNGITPSAQKLYKRVPVEEKKKIEPIVESGEVVEPTNIFNIIDGTFKQKITIPVSKDKPSTKKDRPSMRSRDDDDFRNMILD